MLTYFAAYFSLALVGLQPSRKNETIYLCLIIFLLLIFMGSRYWVGCDFSGYYFRFSRLEGDFNFLSLIFEYEPGFSILINLVAWLNLDYVWLNMAATALMLAGYFKFVKAQYKPLLLIAILFPIVFIQLSMSGIRQGLALSMLVVAMTYFVEKRRLLTGAWILIGASFHASAIIFFPLAFSPWRSISILKLVVGVAFSFIVATTFFSDRFDLYEDRYFTHISGEITSKGALIRYGLTLISTILFVIYRKEFKKYFYDHYQLFLIVGILTISLGFLAVINTVLLHRLLYYVMPVNLAMLLCAVNFVFKPSSRQNGFLIIALSYGFYMLIWFNTSRHASQCYMPYQSYLI